MKIPTLFIAGSVAANVALVIVLLTGAIEKPPARVNVAAVQAVVGTGPVRVEAPAAESETWAALQAEDLSAHRDRLRAEGFSPQMVRAIIRAQVRESFAARRKAFEAAQAAAPYWRNAPPDPATQAQVRALAKEERKMLRDLLGPDPDDATAQYMRRQFPTLSDETLRQIADIQERYDEQRSAVYAAGQGGMATDQDKIEAIDKAMKAEFANVLSPEELADYVMRTSRTTSQLRFDLSAFDATEAEFRTLYALRSKFDEQYGSRGAMSEDQMRARGEGQRQLNEQIAAALGAERYAEYQRATNSGYRQLSQLVARLELPAEAANQVYAVQQDTQRRATAIRQAASSPGERTAQLTALATEAQAKITGSLGVTGFEAYKFYGGNWLTNLVPRPPVPK